MNNVSAVSSDAPSVVVLSEEPVDAVDANADRPSDTTPFEPFDLTRVTPTAADADRLAQADVLVIRDRAGARRVAERGWGCSVVAFVDDPTGPVATAEAVDAVATTRAGLAETIQWIAARDGPARTTAASPTPIERLNAGTARLATAETTEAARNTAVAIADEVFPTYHVVVGVRDDEWVTPVATSAAADAVEYNRVRIGRGVAGRVLETSEPMLSPSQNPESPYTTVLTLPVGENTVLQLGTADSDGFDDTDRRLAELLASHLTETYDRIQATAALRSERDRLLALFSNIPDAAIAYDIVDGEPIVRRVNDAFHETFGYDADTVVGESVDEYIVPPTAAATAEAEDLNTRLKRGENLRKEVTRETTEGERHFILYVIPIQLDAENASGYAIYTDVTERRERESTLKQQNERLDEFASIVSHDLRNPLSVAQGYIDLAHETQNPTHLSKADDALGRMEELVEELLTLARQGRAVGETEPVSIARLARDAWSGVDTAGAELIVADDATITANPPRTRELFENVFRNSVEHGRTGEPTPAGDTDADTLTVRVGGMHLRDAGATTDAGGFFIEDDGVGLPKGVVDRVFESGFTTEDDGTGLGLAITKRIADAHGWHTRALHGETGGARFEFRTDTTDRDT